MRETYPSEPGLERVSPSGSGKGVPSEDVTGCGVELWWGAARNAGNTCATFPTCGGWGTPEWESLLSWLVWGGRELEAGTGGEVTYPSGHEQAGAGAITPKWGGDSKWSGTHVRKP